MNILLRSIAPIFGALAAFHFCDSKQGFAAPLVVQKQSQNSIDHLKTRFANEAQKFRNGYVSASKIPMYQINGKIIQQTGNSVLVWGEASGVMLSYKASSVLMVSPSAPGWVRENDNILIAYREPKNINRDNYSGQHYYMGTKNLRNAFGRLVPCKVYGRPPKSFYTVWTQINQSRKAALSLQKTITGGFNAENERILKGNADDRTLLYKFGRQSLALRDFFTKYDFKSPELSRQAVVYLTKAAIQDAKSNNLAEAATLLNEVFSLKQPDVVVTERANRPGLTENDWERLFGTQTNSSGSLPFSDTTTDVYEKRPELYNALLQAWADALPKYLSQQNPTKKSEVLSLSRRLIDNAPETGVSYAAAVQSALVNGGVNEQSAETSNDEVMSGFGRPFLGVNSVDAGEESGALIERVDPDSPAFEDGVLVGDVVQSFNGKKVAKSEDLQRFVASEKRLATVFLVVLHNGSKVTLKVRLGAVSG